MGFANLSGIEFIEIAREFESRRMHFNSYFHFATVLNRDEMCDRSYHVRLIETCN